MNLEREAAESPLKIGVRRGWPRGHRLWLVAGLGLWVGLALPSVRAVLEATLAGHMVAQIGLLALAGGWLGRGLGPLPLEETGGYNRYGATGVTAALFTLAFWMLPLSLDKALLEPSWEAAKFVSVPLLLGLPLARSWPRLPGLARGVLWANAISMLVVMGWVYREAPGRLCNNYLIDQQLLLGMTLWGLAGGVAGFWIVRAFAGAPGKSQNEATPSEPNQWENKEGIPVESGSAVPSTSPVAGDPMDHSIKAERELL